MSGKLISFARARSLYSDTIPPYELLLAANRIREHYKGDRVGLCSIVNAKSGNCPEDCSFCAQSIHHKASMKRYPLLPEEEIVKAARNARRNNAGCFGIVTSGRTVRAPKEIAAICRAVTKIKTIAPGLTCSVSLGTIGRQGIAELKKAGISRFHHNLETSAAYFPKICTTHTYGERLRTIERAKSAGLRICSGGLFGIGESREDRLKLAFTLRDLGVESVPLNFLHPIKGTALEKIAPMPPLEILRTIALLRLILPAKDIKICGGRAVNLRNLQGMIFFAGANGMMIGNYLTQPGQDPAVDLQMIKDLGLRVQ